MEYGTLVRLTETAKIQAAIENLESDTYGLVVSSVNMGQLLGLPGNHPGFEVFIPGVGIEVFYTMDIEEVVMETKKIVAVSGGFDPVHVGHVRMIREAARHGDVIVIANSDDWLSRKKGYVFMPFEERAEILSAFKGVVKVLEAKDSDNTVCESLKEIQPDVFANGGDRKSDNTPEMDLCNDLGIEMMWNVGGGKIQSSSDLVNNSKAARA